MKLAVFPILALPALVAAQNPPPAPSSSPAGVPVSPTTSSGPSAPTTTGVPTTSLPPPVSFSLASTNPTAVPLSDLVPGTLTTQPMLPPSTTYAPGAVPTFLPNAPPLPNIAGLNPANYPALDKLPPTDSPEVQQWILEVQQSGVHIPDIPVNQPGGCPANPQAVANASASGTCWWTCGGCVRDTDVTDCPDKLVWGLTYDDGPGLYTPELMQYLDQHDLKATLFVVGSRAISYPTLLQDEYMAGHQLAVHTWSHPPPTTISTEAFIAEIGWSKKVIKDITGVTPLYFRPPYGDIDDRIRAILQAMDLTPVIWSRISPTETFDTGDFNVPGGTTTASQVLLNWENIMTNVAMRNSGFIVLEHDLLVQQVDLATGYILPAALANQPPLDIKPVINCLNKPFGDAYLETNDNTTNPQPSASNAAPLTFSSGAPGSAQATKSANSSGNGNTAQSGSTLSANPHTSLLVAAGTAMIGLVAFCSTLL